MVEGAAAFNRDRFAKGGARSELDEGGTGLSRLPAHDDLRRIGGLVRQPEALHLSGGRRNVEQDANPRNRAGNVSSGNIPTRPSPDKPAKTHRADAASETRIARNFFCRTTEAV